MLQYVVATKNHFADGALVQQPFSPRSSQDRSDGSSRQKEFFRLGVPPSASDWLFHIQRNRFLQKDVLACGQGCNVMDNEGK